LRSILKTSVGVALTRAEGDTAVDSHSARSGIGAAKRTGAAICSTANVLVALLGLVGHVVGVELDDGLVTASADQVLGVAGTLLNRVATSELGKRGALTENILLDVAGNVAASTGRVGEEVEVRALCHVTRVVIAVGNGVLEDVDIPSVDEVAVVSVSSWVTLGPDKRLRWVHGLAPHVGVVASLVDSLVEDGDQVDRVGGRAGTAVV
jgi:hypothetical protein